MQVRMSEDPHSRWFATTSVKQWKLRISEGTIIMQELSRHYKELCESSMQLYRRKAQMINP